MLAKESASRLSKCLVACNIYISAGQQKWAPFLLTLLEDAQQRCSTLRQQRSNDPLAIVHAYADGPYDRSSFHVAGSAPLVASLASFIAATAVTSLSKGLKEDEGLSSVADGKDGGRTTAHPTVGLVDHVSILPLANYDTPLSYEEWRAALISLGDDDDDDDDDDETLRSSSSTLPLFQSVPSGWVARSVGRVLEEVGVQVHLYGHADAEETPLATVRRNSTTFFASSLSAASYSRNNYIMGQATVGAPMHFVENYNIQVATTDQTLARGLTKWIRTREGDGLPAVEALTLSYETRQNEDGTQSTTVYEVACNLLNPEETSSQDIDARIEEWPHKGLVRQAYRVGTTAEMCLHALDATNTPQGVTDYDKGVKAKMHGYLGLS